MKHGGYFNDELTIDALAGRYRVMLLRDDPAHDFDLLVQFDLEHRYEREANWDDVRDYPDVLPASATQEEREFLVDYMLDLVRAGQSISHPRHVDYVDNKGV